MKNTNQRKDLSKKTEQLVKDREVKHTLHIPFMGKVRVEYTQRIWLSVEEEGRERRERKETTLHIHIDNSPD